MVKTLKGNKIKILGLAAVFAALVFFGSFFFISMAAAGTRKAPDFDLRVLNPGASGYADFSLKNFKGHVVIINFWATWCPPCRHEIPMIKNFYKSERPNGVIVVGINVNNSVAGVGSFVKQYDIKYPVVYASSGVISNYGDVNEIPQTFFISKSGLIMFHWVGEISRGALYGITDKLIKMN
ncbi:MAG: TlpA family protein disulfide reductase [bacterium]